MANELGDHDENSGQHEADANVVQDADREDSVWANVTLWMSGELAPGHPPLPRRQVVFAPGEGCERTAEDDDEPG
jgi:hypothetical protein